MVQRGLALHPAALALGVLAGALLADPSPAAAFEPCSTRHLTVYELYERAVDVVVATVRSGQPPMHAGPVELEVHERLKGAPSPTVAAREDGRCTAGLRTGKEVLVFVGADGRAVGFWSGVVDLPADATVAAMRAWRDATTAAARVEALVTAMESPDATLAAEAGYYLADDPALLLAIDAAHTERIAGLTGGAQWGPEIVLTRLHGPHLRTLVSSGRLPRDLRAIARQRFEAVSEPAVLALTIVRARRDHHRRVAALERCERLWGRKLAPFSAYNRPRLGDRDWRELAQACRAGAALTDW